LINNVLDVAQFPISSEKTVMMFQIYTVYTVIFWKLNSSV